MAEELTLCVDSMAHGGYGVARIDRKVIFIPYVVKGDKVRIEVVKQKTAFGFGRVASIVEPSPWRIEPACPSFGLCGGCHWQHIEYARHADLKREIVVEMLKRVGGLREIPPIAVLPSESPYGYRLRIRLKAEGDRLGYYQQGSHALVDLNRCPIAHPLINETLQALRKELGGLPEPKELEIRASPDERKTVLLLHFRSLSERDLDRLKGFLRETPLVKGVALLRKRKARWLGDPRIRFALPVSYPGGERTFKFRVSPRSFFQVHLEQNQKLIETVLRFSELQTDETFLDLYAGNGNLTLPLASQGKFAIGVEENPEAVEDALFNGRENGITNCRFVHGKVERILMGGIRKRVDLVVLDPPRSGGKTVVEGIARLRPSRIVYVSCDPGTLARDLRMLHEKGYGTRRLALIDMFPQTYHMEVVALLTESSTEAPAQRPGD